jgi:hypothetical protein
LSIELLAALRQRALGGGAGERVYSHVSCLEGPYTYSPLQFLNGVLEGFGISGRLMARTSTYSGTVLVLPRFL